MRKFFFLLAATMALLVFATIVTTRPTLFLATFFKSVKINLQTFEKQDGSSITRNISAPFASNKLKTDNNTVKDNKVTSPESVNVTIATLADAHVRNGTYATTNYGSSVSLEVESGSTDYTRYAYLKFPLNSVTDVVAAKLRVYGKNVDNTHTINMAVYGVTNDSWNETSINWNTKPAPGTRLNSVGVGNTAQYYEVDVTSYVKAQLSGDKIASFVLRDTTNKATLLQLNSNENVSNHPQLVITTSALSSSNFKVNFQDSATVPPSGWLRDYGQPYGTRTSAYQGSGNTYGWIKQTDNTNLSLTAYGRKRTTPSDILLATLMQMQYSSTTAGRWQTKVVNGFYNVSVSVGDGSYTNSNHYINIEGTPAILNFVPTSAILFRSSKVSVKVTDGLLTVDAIGGTNTKINYISVQPSPVQSPSVVAVNPDNGAQNISTSASISTSILNLPNGGINNATLTSTSVYLTEKATGIHVPAHVNGTGGGDAITLVPDSLLKTSATYVFTITNNAKDLSGAPFIPYSSTFTTSSTSAAPLTGVQFDKIALSNTSGQHTSLTIGPDKKLYALTNDGVIKRFPINADGTLGTPELLNSLQIAYGPKLQTLAVGLAFDPSSTATNLIAWITHSAYGFDNEPDWTGKLSKLTGDKLQHVQDIVINLPRSVKDHATNSIAFGPDGALYFTQGSTSAMGRADNTWGNRNEHLLSAAVLRLDPTKLTTIPLDAKTKDGGGTYNPYASGAPLTIYASGLRNAYDLVWHSNGELYVPTNGSASGGNTPASVTGTLRPNGTTYNGPSVPALTNVQQTMRDFLFRVKKGGYYGHPNPIRGEYVLNGGNPTTAVDPSQVDAYPVGTQPDANWRGYAFDFQANKSADGVIEYKSNTFNGALKGRLLVVRFSQNDDIIVLTTGGTNNDIVSYTEGASISGFTGFIDPIDLTEDVRNGNIYVSEYDWSGSGNGKITLLKPHLSSTTTAIIGGLNTGTPDRSLSNGTAYLEQNIPNPSGNNTIIRYHVPFPAASVKIIIMDMNGAEVRSIPLSSNGYGQVTLNTNMLTAGTYSYSLWIDGKQVDVKKMVILR